MRLLHSVAIETMDSKIVQKTLNEVKEGFFGIDGATITADHEKGTIRVMVSGIFLTLEIFSCLTKLLKQGRKVYAKRSGTKFGLYIS